MGTECNNLMPLYNLRIATLRALAPVTTAAQVSADTTHGHFQRHRTGLVALSTIKPMHLQEASSFKQLCVTYDVDAKVIVPSFIFVCLEAHALVKYHNFSPPLPCGMLRLNISCR